MYALIVVRVKIIKQIKFIEVIVLHIIVMNVYIYRIYNMTVCNILNKTVKLTF